MGEGGSADFQLGRDTETCCVHMCMHSCTGVVVRVFECTRIELPTKKLDELLVRRGRLGGCASCKLRAES